MSFYLTWIVAERSEAAKICDVNNEEDRGWPRLEIKNLSQLELDFLWTIIEANPALDDPKVEWNAEDVSRHRSKPLAMIPDLQGLSEEEVAEVAADGLSMVDEVPAEFITLLSDVNPGDVARYADHWGRFEELQTFCEFYENNPLPGIISDLSVFARESIKLGLPVLNHSVI